MHFLCTPGLTEQIALPDLVAAISQNFALRLGFHAFSDQIQIQAGAQIAHRLNNGPNRGVLRNALHKILVDLDAIDRVVTQVCQRRLAGAKVIQRNAHARSLEALERTNHVLGTALSQHMFGDLNFDQAGGQVQMLKVVQQALRIIVTQKFHRRRVE